MSNFLSLSQGDHLRWNSARRDHPQCSHKDSWYKLEKVNYEKYLKTRHLYDLNFTIHDLVVSLFNMETFCELSFGLCLRISRKGKLFPGTQREESQVARMGWSRVIRFSEVSFSEVCISVILSKALGRIKWHFCEGYEAGKIRDDLLHRGTVKPRGGGWRKSGEWTQGKNKTLSFGRFGSSLKKVWLADI